MAEKTAFVGDNTVPNPNFEHPNSSILRFVNRQRNAACYVGPTRPKRVGNFSLVKPPRKRSVCISGLSLLFACNLHLRG